MRRRLHTVLGFGLGLALTGLLSVTAGPAPQAAAGPPDPHPRGTVAPPVLRMDPLPARSPGVRYRIGWSPDPHFPQPTSVEVQRRARAYDGGLGLWDPVRHRGHQTSVAYRSKAGRTTCFRVRGTGPGGDVGPWSTPECTTTAVDDHVLAAGPRWNPDRDLQHYQHTIQRTRRRHAELRLADVKAASVWLLFERMSSGGTVAVYLNRHRLGRVVLAGEHRFRASLPVADFGRARRGHLRIVVLSAHRDVRIDGVYLLPAG